MVHCQFPCMFLLNLRSHLSAIIFIPLLAFMNALNASYKVTIENKECKDLNTQISVIGYRMLFI